MYIPNQQTPFNIDKIISILNASEFQGCPTSRIFFNEGYPTPLLINELGIFLRQQKSPDSKKAEEELLRSLSKNEEAVHMTAYAILLHARYDGIKLNRETIDALSAYATQHPDCHDGAIQMIDASVEKREAI